MTNAILLDERDNVATCTSPATKGDTIKILGGGAIFCAEDIPIWHKVALKPIHAGEKVFKYGEVIGKALVDIPKGGRVFDENIFSVPRDYKSEYLTRKFSASEIFWVLRESARQHGDKITWDELEKITQILGMTADSEYIDEILSLCARKGIEIIEDETLTATGERMQFWGYKRDDGRAGIRNHVLILPTCACGSETVRIVASQKIAFRLFFQIERRNRL